MVSTLKYFITNVIYAIRSEYKWMFILFVVWLYRVDFIPDTGDGGGKIIQVTTLLGMFYLTTKFYKGVLRCCIRSNRVVSSFTYLYLFAILSTVWSIMPSFSFFLAFQNVVLLMVFFWLFSNFETFESLERVFLTVTVMIILFEAITLRLTYQPFLLVHYLPAGSSAALCISYCSGELMSMREDNYLRRQLLRNCIIVSLVILATSTSSGANVSAVFGVAIASLLSGRMWIGLLLVLISSILFIYKDFAESLMYLLMPGKTEVDLKTATGRKRLWDIMLNLAAKRPWFGYGFGCIERAATMTGKIQSPDAHNNYLGLYGSLGYIGSAIAYLHFLFFAHFTFVRRKFSGFTGIVSALACALLNGYTFGFLSGKACSITVVFIELVVLTYYYAQIQTTDESNNQ